MSYNKIILEGHLTRDVEIKYTQSGSAIANTGIAVSKKFKKQDGTQGEKVLFVDLTFFGRSGEIANQYLRKGSHILVDGELNLDTWEKDGVKKSKHSVNVKEMQMLGSKGEATHAPSQSQPAPSAPPQNQQAAMPEIDINEDAIPFAPIDKRL